MHLAGRRLRIWCSFRRSHDNCSGGHQVRLNWTSFHRENMSPRHFLFVQTYSSLRFCFNQGIRCNFRRFERSQFYERHPIFLTPAFSVICLTVELWIWLELLDTCLVTLKREFFCSQSIVSLLSLVTLWLFSFNFSNEIWLLTRL